MERNLLLVDDEKRVTSALLRLLHCEGYNVYVANSPDEALNLLEQHVIHVVVTDQKMPGQTGIELLRQARFLRPQLYGIVLSGQADVSTVVQAFNEKSIERFIPKPWENLRLKEVLREAFEMIEQRREHDATTKECGADLAKENLSLRAQLMARNALREQTALLDPLTGLANREGFSLLLQQAISKSVSDELVAVLLLDIKHFKWINDSYGYPVGDMLLRTAAERMRISIREQDGLARLGGDEFAFVLAGLTSVEQVGQVAEKLLEKMSTSPFVVNDLSFSVTANLGVSIYPYDGSSVGELLQHSDFALDKARLDHGGSVQYYMEEMDVSARARLEIEKELREAIDQNQLMLFYQPKIDVTSGRIAGMEALLRWNHPARGVVSPAEFIPVLEETGLILPVGRWVLVEAHRQLVEWLGSGFDYVKVAVNLSALQFKQNLLQTIQEVLANSRYTLPEGALEFELTESLLMQNAEEALPILRQIQSMGIRLSIDDFGTGYSSLSYLRKFRVDSLKIDQSFVQGLPENDEDKAIVSAIIALAHSLKMKVVAEGVERPEQSEALRIIGCDEMQGYLFSRPVPAAQMTELLRSNVNWGQRGDRYTKNNNDVILQGWTTPNY